MDDWKQLLAEPRTDWHPTCRLIHRPFWTSIVRHCCLSSHVGTVKDTLFTVIFDQWHSGAGWMTRCWETDMRMSRKDDVLKAAHARRVASEKDERRNVRGRVTPPSKWWTWKTALLRWRVRCLRVRIVHRSLSCVTAHRKQSEQSIAGVGLRKVDSSSYWWTILFSDTWQDLTKPFFHEHPERQSDASRFGPHFFAHFWVYRVWLWWMKAVKLPRELTVKGGVNTHTHNFMDSNPCDYSVSGVSWVIPTTPTTE